MGFTLCLVFFSILGGKTVAREMIFYSLMVLLTQGRITNQHLVLTSMPCLGSLAARLQQERLWSTGILKAAQI